MIGSHLRAFSLERNILAVARFVILRDETDFLVLDTKIPDEPVIVCHCSGYKAPLQAEYVCQALEHYHNSLMEKLYVVQST